MNSPALSSKQEKYVISAIILISFTIMTVTALCRQFVTDDWLWLNHARNLFSDPSLLIEKPMFGYYRPAFIIWFSFLHALWGTNSVPYSITHIILHCINVYLFWSLLKQNGISQMIRLGAALFFGTYFLNASAVGWISVGHDIWVLFLAFMFCMITSSFIEKSSAKNAFLVLLTGIAAILFKENGIVTLGIYYLFFILKKENPFAKKYRSLTLIISFVYTAYVIWFFSTRGYVNNETEISFKVIERLWFLLAYSLSPLTESTTHSLPSPVVLLFMIVRYSMIVIIPFLLFYAALKRKGIPLVGGAWAVMFLSTVAIMKTDSSLFSTYPSILMTRYFYVAIPGISLVIFWGIAHLFRSFKQKRTAAVLILILTPCYLFASTFAGYKGNSSSRARQVRAQRVITSFNEEYKRLLSSNTLFVIGLEGEVPWTYAQKDFPTVEMSSHFESLLSVKFNKNITVVNMEFHDEDSLHEINWRSYRTPVLRWDSRKDQLVLINEWPHGTNSSGK